MSAPRPAPALPSRPTETGIFGKCDDRIDISAPTALKELLTMLAVMDDQSLGGYVRRLLEDHALRERERVKRILAAHGVDTDGRNRG